MATGAPIDASIRKITTLPIKNPVNIPDSKTDLDPAPQIIMVAGDEQFAFQYDDGLGDGRDQYQGYGDSGASAPAAGGSNIDTIGIHIEKPKNKTYYISYNVPFPIEILGHSHAFETGSGSVSYQSGTVNTGGSLTIVVSGLSTSPAAADLLIQITVRTHQVS